MQFFKSPEAGIPNSGVTSVGEIANTKFPVPVSSLITSLITPANSVDVVGDKC